MNSHSVADAATLTWLGDLGSNWSGGAPSVDTNWTSNSLPVAADTLVFDLTIPGVSNLSSTNDLSGLSLGGPAAISFVNDAVGGAGFTLGGNALTLGGNITSSGATGTRTHTIALGLILNGTRTVTSVTGTNIAITGAISETGGAFGLVKAGADTVTLSGANTFTGPLSINQGVLSASSIADSGVTSAIGAGSVVNLGNAAQTGTLTFTGTGGSTNRTINLGSAGVGGGVINSSGTGAITLTGSFANAGTGAKTFTLGGTFVGANEVQSNIGNGSGGGTLAVTKVNAGSWILSGNNSFTGALSVNQGTLTVPSLGLAGVNSAAGAGSQINLGGGAQTGALVYTGPGGSTNRALNLGSAGAGGGTISSSGTGPLVITGTFTNAGTGAKTLTFGGSFAGANEVQSNIGNGSAGGTLAVTKANGGSWIVSGDNSFTGGLSVNQGTLIINTLANSGLNSAAGAGNQINLGSGTQTGTLVYTGSGAVTNRTLSLASAGAGGGTVNSSGSGALVFSGLFSNVGSAAKTLTLGGSFAGPNEIQSVLTNGSGGGELDVTKVDVGRWVLSGANTYSGTTTLSAGTLVLSNGGSGGLSSSIGTGPLVITGGTLDNTAASPVTLSTNNPVAVNGNFAFGGTRDLHLGDGIVTIGNANREITLEGNGTLRLGEVQWNSVNAARFLAVNRVPGGGSRLVLGGFQLNVNADTAARNRTISGSADVEITGPIANGNTFSNGLIYAGPGSLSLSGANAYTGVTTVNGGTLKLTSAAAIGASSALVVNAGSVDVAGQAAAVSGPLTLGAASTNLGSQPAVLTSSIPGGSFAPGGNITYNAGSTGLENGPATIAAGLVLTADRTLTVNDSPNATADLLVSGVISGAFGLTKANVGTLRLSASNTFTGPALLHNGTTQVLSLGDVGATSALGTGDKDAAASVIRLGNVASTATLEYLGAAATTNRRVQIGSGTGAVAAGGATILSNGPGAVSFTAPSFNQAANVGANGSTAARVLTLGGENAGANVILGAIIDNAGASTSGTNAVAVTKQGSGNWELAGANTYSGSTSVHAGTLLVSGSLQGTTRAEVTGGTLLLGGSDRIQSSAELILGGGTFATGGFSEGSVTTPGLATLTLSGSSTLNFGAGIGSILHFGALGSRSAGATLAITNFQGAGNAGDDRLIFSGSSLEFTSLWGQSEVSFDGIAGFAMLQLETGRYEIVPVPEPTSGALVVAGTLFGLIGFREGRYRHRRSRPSGGPENAV